MMLRQQLTFATHLTCCSNIPNSVVQLVTLCLMSQPFASFVVHSSVLPLAVALQMGLVNATLMLQSALVEWECFCLPINHLFSSFSLIMLLVHSLQAFTWINMEKRILVTNVVTLCSCQRKGTLSCKRWFSLMPLIQTVRVKIAFLILTFSLSFKTTNNSFSLQSKHGQNKGFFLCFLMKI